MTKANILSQLGSAGVSTGFKNRIINGSMAIDQWHSGASYNVQGGEYAVDRWATNASQTSKFSAQQNAGSITPPIGFSNYLGLTSIAATTVGAGDIFNTAQYIEGFNFADMQWGTANAKTITLSAWVYSSLTGTFGGALTNSSASRSYPFSYSIPVANTWTQISILIAGDTTGTWIGATNGIGVRVYFSLGTGSTRANTAGAWAAGDYRTATGSVNVVSTNGATLYITGVQIEVGTTATNFDYRPYGTEFSLCQRYYSTGFMISSKTAAGAGSTYNATFQTQMRSAPTFTGTIVAGQNTSAPFPYSTSTYGQIGYSNGGAVGDFTYWNFTANAEL